MVCLSPAGPHVFAEASLLRVHPKPETRWFYRFVLSKPVLLMGGLLLSYVLFFLFLCLGIFVGKANAESRLVGRQLFYVPVSVWSFGSEMPVSGWEPLGFALRFVQQDLPLPSQD